MYSATKGALRGFVMSLSHELAKSKVRVNAIAPGFVKVGVGVDFAEKITSESLANYEQKYPLGIGYPTDISDMVEFLLSKKARWITGQTITVDGGISVT